MTLMAATTERFGSIRISDHLFRNDCQAVDARIVSGVVRHQRNAESDSSRCNPCVSGVDRTAATIGRDADFSPEAAERPIGWFDFELLKPAPQTGPPRCAPIPFQAPALQLGQRHKRYAGGASG